MSARGIYILFIGISLVTTAAGLELQLASSKQQKSPATTAQPVKRVVVNGMELNRKTIQQLEAAYQVQLVSGSFWYDRLSGLWGVTGGPAFGQILPGLNLGGRLGFNASGGKTNVVINGRAIHPQELQVIVATYGYAIPGRYWLDARGNVGVEGGPFLFNMYATGMGQSGRSWYHSGPGGYMASDGNCIGFTAPGGESYLSSAC